jgi:hypothetical protein
LRVGGRMRLINSDGQIVDAKVAADAKDSGSANANSNSNSARVDISAIAFVSVLALAVMAFIFANDAKSDARHSRELLDMQRDYWKASFDQAAVQQRQTEKAAELTATEYRVLLNHYMELESQLKEIRHGRR